MYRLVLVVGTAALLNVACGGANLEEERNTLLRLDREWSEAASDPDKFMGFFAADASFYPPGMPVAMGAGPIRDTFTKMMSMPGSAVTFGSSKAEVSESGDVGYTTGTYEMTMAGMPPEKGKYVTVWKKQADGEWKVVEDIFNADSGPAPGSHVMVAPASITWGDVPPSLPSGAKLAVIAGDPSKPVPFVIRVQAPRGYRIAPHWHPTDENVTVLSGTVALGMGEAWDDAKLESLPSGGYVTLPAEMRHYFMARTASTIQIHGMGSFAVNYVNPADDPSQKK